jgi:hypothetical protein
MLHALQPAQLRRMDKNQLKAVAEHCEQALLSGLSTHQDMMTLIEVEKELSRRERIDTRQQILDVRRTMIEQLPSVKLTPATPVPVVARGEAETNEEPQEGLELLPVAPNRY